MTRQRHSLLTPLALLGLLVGLAELSHGSAGEDEDYYMQELLTRDQYNRVQMLEKPVASIPDRHEHPSQNPVKKVPKGKAESSRQMDKTINTKSVKAANKKTEKNKKSILKTPNSISEGEGQYSSIKEGIISPLSQELLRWEKSNKRSEMINILEKGCVFRKQIFFFLRGKV